VPFAFDETPAIGYWPNIVANKELGWEKTATINAGIDFGFWNNTIMGAVDVYHTKTSDLLMERILPSVTGFNNIIDNVGKTKTSGIDITLSTRNISTPKFTWTTDLNYSMFNEEIVALSVGGDDVSKGWFVGKPLRVHYDYEKIGIWQNGDKDEATKYNKKPGEIKVKDQNNDGLITAAADRVVLGQASPKWTAGMSNNFSYRNLSLSVLVYARVGQTISSDYAGSYYPGGLFNTAVVDYWTPENPTNAYPRPIANVTDQYLSTLRYLDGSFFKIKDIRLLYNLTKSNFKKMPFSNVAVYATAKNYFTFSNVKNYDPERGGSVDYPLTKQLVFGLNVAF
jgi:TonB-dependent starch-binding outer membrane protein SusC